MWQLNEGRVVGIPEADGVALTAEWPGMSSVEGMVVTSVVREAGIEFSCNS